MLPGKIYKPEDFLDIARRRYWYLLVPVALVAAGTAAVTAQMPNRYRSEAMIMVVPQGVTPGYVIPAVTRGIEDRLPSITQQLLSRSRLEPIIRDFNLYSEWTTGGISEDVIGQMRNAIDISPSRGNTFHVSFAGENPRVVLKVTERLASSLIAENVASRASLAQGTSQFLEAQLDDARRRLLEHEQKLESYRRRYATELPSQTTANVQVIQNTQMQIQSLAESTNRDRDERLAVQRQLEDLRAELNTPVTTTMARPDDDRASYAAQLAEARANLVALEQRFKPTHPEIGIAKRRIRDLEAKAIQEASAAPSPVTTTAVRAPSAAQKRRLTDLETQLSQFDKRIANKQSEEARLRSELSGYQRRVDMAPMHESEMVELTRDYATLQSIYANLLTKKEESKIAADLEQRQIGEQLRLVDPARLPEGPFSPNRRRINALGLLAGLGLGVALIALLEYRDGTFRTDDEVLRVLALPVLAVVPVMVSDSERKRLRAREFALHVGLGSTVIVCLAVVAYSFVS
jgi:polysaccharide chain length determinant protein (PEP-CTERM system associated)